MTKQTPLGQILNRVNFFFSNNLNSTGELYTGKLDVTRKAYLLRNLALTVPPHPYCRRPPARHQICKPTSSKHRLLHPRIAPNDSSSNVPATPIPKQCNPKHTQYNPIKSIINHIHAAPPAMENPLDQTSATTISLLEARLLRIEHLLCGASTPATAPAHHESASQRMAELEKRFAALTSHVRVYDELLKICTPSPFFPLGCHRAC